MWVIYLGGSGGIYNLWTLSHCLNEGVEMSYSHDNINEINIPYTTLMRDKYLLHNINIDENMIGS